MNILTNYLYGSIENSDAEEGEIKGKGEKKGKGKGKGAGKGEEKRIRKMNNIRTRMLNELEAEEEAYLQHDRIGTYSALTEIISIIILTFLFVLSLLYFHFLICSYFLIFLLSSPRSFLLSCRFPSPHNPIISSSQLSLFITPTPTSPPHTPTSTSLPYPGSVESQRTATHSSS